MATINMSARYALIRPQNSSPIRGFPSDETGMNMIDAPTIFAWVVIAVLLLVIVVAIVVLGSLPKKIALKRNHPQVDAINAASWIGLALMGTGWPIAFVWAFLRAGPIGAGSADPVVTPDELRSKSPKGPRHDWGELEARIVKLEAKLAECEPNESKTK